MIKYDGPCIQYSDFKASVVCLLQPWANVQKIINDGKEMQEHNTSIQTLNDSNIIMQVVCM